MVVLHKFCLIPHTQHMTTFDLLDPEILPALKAFPDVSLERSGLPALREAAARAIKLSHAEDFGVSRSETRIPGITPDKPEVRCLVYTPQTRTGLSGAYLHLHGGGYIAGSPEASDLRNVRLARALGIVVVSVAYRLAPEHPAPAALEDAYAALAWIHLNSDKLGIDTGRVAIGGESAGGGLAAALAQYAHRAGEYGICFQALTYPMLDDRTGTPAQPGDPLTGEFVWTRERNQLGWSYYLGEANPSAPYVPAMATNLDGLPPAWIGTAALDLFRDENIDYAQRLLKAGVSTELIVYPGACHGFQMAPEASVTKQYLRDHTEALGRHLQSST